MSFWVRAYLLRPAGPLDVGIIIDGISQRLPLLTYLFCPDQEEEPEVVLARLRVSAENSDNLRIYFREEVDRYIPVERYFGDRVEEEVEEAMDDLNRYPDRDGQRVRERLSGIVETIGFELKYSDAEGMGLPVTVAAAAKLVDLFGGIINTDDFGWMIPSGNEVEIILEA